MTTTGLEWVLVERCISIGHAETLSVALRREGIETELRGQHRVALEPEYVELWVQARNAERAVEALRRLRTQDEPPEIRCPRCGEESPATFDRCWSCGSTLEIAPVR